MLCLVVALIFNLPVPHLMQWVKLPSSVQVSGIDGTLMRGRAREVSINQFPVRDLKYRYLPSCIPRLKLCYRLQYDRGEIFLAYDLLNGDAEISDSLVEYTVSELMAHVPNALVQPAGKLELGIEEASYQDGRPQTVQGNLIWRDLGLDDAGIKVSIGDYKIDFTGNNTGYDFVISDLNASLDVSGKGNLKPGGIYAVDLRISGENGIDANVKKVLDLVAASAGHNKYRVRQTGRLPAHITRQLFR